jgi:uncharacterized protein YggU (UPF0235/DUF167 family)
MRIRVRVIPRAKRDQITESDDGGFRVHTTAAPADGRANDAVARLLSEHFGIAKSRLQIVRGAGSRDKVIEVME